MKVSVAMIAYNHAPFVEQALESVLAQRADFDWEIVFGEDCSPDGTREIVQRIAAAHPQRIRLLLPEENLGMNRNFATTIGACTGEYVAICEGDDFWIDPEKLQRQAGYLDTHPHCATCFARSEVVNERGENVPAPSPIRVVQPEYTLEDFLERKFHPRTCTVMFRRGLFGAFPDWFYDMPGGDFPMHVLNGTHGKFGFIDCVMSAYRIHPGGIWSQGVHPSQWGEAAHDVQARRLRDMIRLYETVDRALGYRHHALLGDQIGGFLYALAGHQRVLRDWPGLRGTLWKAARSRPSLRRLGVRWLLRGLLAAHLPAGSRS